MARRQRETIASQLQTRVLDVASGCKEWQGFRLGAGYGLLWVDGVRYSAHREAYTLAYGAIPPGFDIHHTCRNKACCNPDHLRAVSRSEHCELDNALGVQYRRATTCVNGHPLDETNTYRYTHRGHEHRACRTCKAARNTERMRQRTLAKTHCKHGHEFTPENTTLAQWDGKTRRYCRTCYGQPRPRSPK